ncbi:flagellar biosynthesis protein FlhA [Pseudobacteriovorax antillogorgiicola]|uniref:Flagellar biosynthesis protein FlhA n=1 Tax=Pseudobacteriovorax antillogorgiicola TaxID=1513793 RepID=A0A1Y6CPN0_9BACT|nr:flagellar biosynthesis protein FlhA [Pseudobacteriovorax antillogorgiicola]TCS46656.1 flagellar biosynthesis protein FlhA [Pseudobacteriovorax antillogorgiicola]SMF66476.1 flagellar biosynthesis protein FlhA [Pseudobacteriovorax antillogorgiicola]
MTLIKSPDVQFAFGVFGIIFTMILPLPPLLLDIFLTLSISVSFIVLLISIYVKEPLEFSTFPTVLLITTLLRLGLNVATTRSILLDAPTGKVSSVISSFGDFVVGGNYFVGFVIFAILVIINFIVITKGAGRVAEVGARFTLDAMPGKQMAIDAELNAGLIDKKEARKRRTKIEAQADFYGAMDGASKFVRGDAIAGIIITAINIVVGLAVGVVIYDMSFSKAAEVFTLLTVGDGLVSQIPALVISTAAGIVVTRTGVSDDRGISDEMHRQVFAHPKAIYICSTLLGIMAVVPGMPGLPFGILAVSAFFVARFAKKSLENQAIEEAKKKEKKADEGASESIEDLLHIDQLALEVGVGLIPLVDSAQDGEVLERIVSARKQFAQEFGIVVPMVMVRDNIQLKPGEYQVMLKGNVIGRGNLMVDYLLAMDPGDIIETIDGIPGREPAYGLDAIWIKQSQKEEATFRGYTVVNCATVIVTHLTKLIEEHGHELIGRQEVQNLIDGLRDEYPKVVEEVLSNDRLTLGDVVRVLQILLEEKVSIRDLLTIFETLADHGRNIKNPEVLSRYVRKALGRGIIKRYLDMDGKLTVVTLDRAVEDLLVSGLQHREDGSTSLQVDPEMAQRILNNIAQALEAFQTTGTQPIILCGSLIRWEIKQLVNRFIPGVVVMAFDEIPAGIETNAVGIVNM